MTERGKRCEGVRLKKRIERTTEMERGKNKEGKGWKAERSKKGRGWFGKHTSLQYSLAAIMLFTQQQWRVGLCGATSH